MEPANVYQSVLPEEETKLYKGLKKFIYEVGIGGIIIGAVAYAQSALNNYMGAPEAAILLNKAIGNTALFWGSAICSINFAVGRFISTEIIDKPSDLELSTRSKTDSLDGNL